MHLIPTTETQRSQELNQMGATNREVQRYTDLIQIDPQDSIHPETFIIHNEFFGSSMREQPEIRERLMAGLVTKYKLLDLEAVQLYYKLFVFLTASFKEKVFFVLKYLAYPLQYFNQDFYKNDLMISYLTQNLKMLLN